MWGGVVGGNHVRKAKIWAQADRRTRAPTGTEAALDAMLVETPRWMFDAAHCATLRLTERPHVDCATLRTLKNSITEQRVSVKASLVDVQR